MSILSEIQEQMKIAMKSRDADRLNVLRFLKAKLAEAKIAQNRELTEEEEIVVIQKNAKMRKEAIKQYQQNDRLNLAELEQNELKIIQEFLPQQLSEGELEQLVWEAIAEIGATTMQDMGKAMGASMKKIAGRADGKKVQEIVRRKLG
ncbi:MAG: GatB/YqeY domain-containing protein [Candidatus Marinimicrobia bacterium]|nr:GatB/YqeY domain-containing protein [Candidatus Neomarinimicrobiota bacterium]